MSPPAPSTSMYRNRIGKTPRRLEAAGAPLRARLWLDVLAPHQAGQRRLRFRFSGDRIRRARRRAVDLLIDLRRSGARSEPEPRDFRVRSLTLAPRNDSIGTSDVKTQRSHPQQAQDRLHRHRRHRAVQARAPDPDDPGCIRPQPRSADHGRRSLHAALHAGARGPQQARRVPRPRASAAQGDRGLSGWRGACAWTAARTPARRRPARSW